MRSFALAMSLLLSAFFFFTPPLIATAQDAPPAEATGPKAALLAASCTGCHVKNTGEDGLPSIYGRPAVEIRDILLAFRSGERKSTVMQRLAKGYDDGEIDLLAAYFAAQSGAE